MGFLKLVVVLVAVAQCTADQGSALTDLFALVSFLGPASSAASSMTALALNAGTKKAAEWFYLSHWSKTQAVHSIRKFEEITRISLSGNMDPFFCSTILYLQGAALAMQKDANEEISTLSNNIKADTVPATVASLLSAYPTATGYGGYCVQLFPSPRWRETEPPCEGAPNMPDTDGIPGVALFSLKCLADVSFDWRKITSGYRPGGVSALTAGFAPVVPLSAAPKCSNKRNSDMVTRIVGMMVQSFFTQLMVGPVGAMLTMEVKEVCSSGFESGYLSAGAGESSLRKHQNCMNFENIMALFFESLNSAAHISSGLEEDLQCLLFRADVDPFAEFDAGGGGGGH